MLAMVPRAAMSRGATGAAPGGRGKTRPGLGSKPGKDIDTVPADGSVVAGTNEGSGHQAQTVKDNDYFRNLFSKGGSL